MDIIFGHVAGLDVHKRTVVACVRKLQPQGNVLELVETFGTMTSDLLRMLDWLTAHQVTHVAMESTGVLWKPLWNVLEGHVQLLLVNPRELKQVPGRKSNMRDCQWIAHLLQCGLLRSSFVPARPQRELRDLTRQRASWWPRRRAWPIAFTRRWKTPTSSWVRWLRIFWAKSGRAMLRAILSGERDPRKLADLAKGALRRRIPELTKALQGHWTEHHTFMIRSLLNQVQYLEGEIEAFSERIDICLHPFLTAEQMERLDEIPGVNRVTVENIVAEIGTDMSRFPSPSCALPGQNRWFSTFPWANSAWVLQIGVGNPM